MMANVQDANGVVNVEDSTATRRPDGSRPNSASIDLEPIVSKVSSHEPRASSLGSSCGSTMEPVEPECFLDESPCGSTIVPLEPGSCLSNSSCGSVLPFSAGQFGVHSNDNCSQSDNAPPVQFIPCFFLSPQAVWPMLSQAHAVNHQSSQYDMSQCAPWPTAEADPIHSDGSDTSTSKGYQGSRCQEVEPPEAWLGTLTVMMRNLPNKYSQDMLLEEINEAGYRGSVDFIYLPLDVETKRNKGYAFVNFINDWWSWSFKCYYDGRRMNLFNSVKFVVIAPAVIQGFESNQAMKKVKDGPMISNTVDEVRSSNPGIDSQKSQRGGRRNVHDKASLPQAKQEDKKGVDGKHRAFRLGEKARERNVQSMTLERKFCPYCGNKVAPEFLFCQFCGKGLS